MIFRNLIYDLWFCLQKILDLYIQHMPISSGARKFLLIYCFSCCIHQHCKIRSFCFSRMASLSQWLVFGMVHGLPLRIGILWVGLPTLTSQSESDEEESTKWRTNLLSNLGHLVISRMYYSLGHGFSPFYLSVCWWYLLTQQSHLQNIWKISTQAVIRQQQIGA